MDLDSIKISNIVISFTLNERLNRNEIKLLFPSIVYPKKFSGGVLKFTKGCLLIFDSAKMIATGNENVESAIDLIEKFCSVFGRSLHYTSYKIVNIVTHSKLSIDFDYKLLQYFPLYTYEPELFPGVHIKVDDSKIIFIVFRSGKVIATGFKEVAQIKYYYEKFTKVYDNLKLYLHMYST